MVNPRSSPHSCAAISAGSAVYDSYGKKCQHRFLLNYGFSVEDIVEAEQGRAAGLEQTILNGETRYKELERQHRLRTTV